jgi:hypothetical protein
MGKETFQQTKGSMDTLNNPFPKASKKHRWESNKKKANWYWKLKRGKDLHGTHPCPMYLEFGCHLQANHVTNKQNNIWMALSHIDTCYIATKFGDFRVHGTWQCNMEWTR